MVNIINVPADVMAENFVDFIRTTIHRRVLTVAIFLCISLESLSSLSRFRTISQIQAFISMWQPRSWIVKK